MLFRYFILLVAVLSMSMAPIFIRLAVAPALAIALWRIVLAWPVLATTSAIKKEKWPSKYSIIAGSFLALHWVTWIVAIQNTTIASATIIISTGGLWTALLSKPVLGEKISKNQWIGLLVALCGVIIIVTSKNQYNHSLFGDIMALASTMAWVGYTFIGRKARINYGFWGYTSSVYLAGALCIFAVAITRGTELISFNVFTWVLFAALAIFPTLLGHGGVNYLLKYFNPAQISLWILIEPILATLAAWPLFGEVPTIRILLGGLITIGGIILGEYRPQLLRKTGNT